MRYVPLNPTVHRVFQIYTHDISVTTLQTVHFFNVLRLIGGGVVARTSQIGSIAAEAAVGGFAAPGAPSPEWALALAARPELEPCMAASLEPEPSSFRKARSRCSSVAVAALSAACSAGYCECC